MSPIKLLTVTAAAVAVLSATALPASAASRTRLVNGATGLCLAVGKSEVRAGKRVIQWNCNGLKDQAWVYRDHRLVNAKTGMCLAIAHGSTQKAKPAIQWPCTDGGLEQEWVYDDLQRFQNRATGQCLAIGRGEAKPGKYAIQWPCKTTAEQAWMMQ
ncbi:RICIN domain-containing protein [Nonomuraea sp. NPDC050536]|uniref:RICIN domain-containing protein n=1 Tax=Nonomuraea sp. NPDC050536 TaxID=3364366 RepID=UPI0037C80492